MQVLKSIRGTATTKELNEILKKFCLGHEMFIDAAVQNQGLFSDGVLDFTAVVVSPNLI